MIQNIIENIPNGKIFSIIFIKKDGSKRHMNCMKGVKKYLKGGNSTYNGIHNDKNNIGVYDLKIKQYRCFNINSVIELKYNKQIYYHDKF